MGNEKSKSEVDIIREISAHSKKNPRSKLDRISHDMADQFVSFARSRAIDGKDSFKENLVVAKGFYFAVESKDADTIVENVKEILISKDFKVDKCYISRYDDGKPKFLNVEYRVI